MHQALITQPELSDCTQLLHASLKTIRCTCKGWFCFQGPVVGLLHICPTMPLHSAHVFASHIGHTGKTTLAFQMSCNYALRHPELSVLVMDLAEEGDLTKRLLGGLDCTDKVDLYGGIFRLLSDADRATSLLTGWLWTDNFDATKYAVHVADHNASVPPNLLLISSGAWPRNEDPMADKAQIDLLWASPCLLGLEL